MPEVAPSSGDEQTERIMGSLLIFGVALAAAVVLSGAVLYLVRYGTTAPAYRVFHGEPPDLRSFGGICRDALVLRSRGLIQLGLLLLIGTPVARVAFSVVAFARQGDLLYTMVTLVVLGLLVYSLAGGKL